MNTKAPLSAILNARPRRAARLYSNLTGRVTTETAQAYAVKIAVRLVIASVMFSLFGYTDLLRAVLGAVAGFCLADLAWAAVKEWRLVSNKGGF